MAGLFPQLRKNAVGLGFLAPDPELFPLEWPRGSPSLTLVHTPCTNGCWTGMRAGLPSACRAPISLQRPAWLQVQGVL